jgi:general L-amino acid transport system permease protein
MRRGRGRLIQAAVAAALLAVLAVLAWTAGRNLEARQIASGFAFLWREAGFEIGETAFLAYSAADSYARALAIGLANTFRVAALGVVLATVLGLSVGLARLSPNWLLAQLAAAYVETLRNVPLLVQLFFWYAIISEGLPPPAEALQPLPGVFLSNRGIFFPLPGDAPELSGFNFTGGAGLSPEFATLLVGLATYTAAFIAEIVRAGIESVPRGQREAARSLGLDHAGEVRYVVLPQALRLAVPPLTSQYLNLAKNSSLAVAIGYPDFVSIANTTMNQTGQAIEGVALIMAVFLSISLSISAFMNWYNRRVALRGLLR